MTDARWHPDLEVAVTLPLATGGTGGNVGLGGTNGQPGKNGNENRG